LCSVDLIGRAAGEDAAIEEDKIVLIPLDIRLLYPLTIEDDLFDAGLARLEDALKI